MDPRSKKRAEKTFRALPLNLNFYNEVHCNGLNSQKVFENISLYKVDGSSWFNNVEDVEAAFRWLIKVGVLRREVDGQGLTSKIRITPLGREMLEINPNLPSNKSYLLEKLTNWFFRKWSLI